MRCKEHLASGNLWYPRTFDIPCLSIGDRAQIDTKHSRLTCNRTEALVSQDNDKAFSKIHPLNVDHSLLFNSRLYILPHYKGVGRVRKVICLSVREATRGTTIIYPLNITAIITIFSILINHFLVFTTIGLQFLKQVLSFSCFTCLHVFHVTAFLSTR